MSGDPNFWVAVMAIITVAISFLTAAYSYGSLSQKVKMMADTAEDQRALMRSAFDDLRRETTAKMNEMAQELRDLRNRLWRHGNLN